MKYIFNYKTAAFIIVIVFMLQFQYYIESIRWPPSELWRVDKPKPDFQLIMLGTFRRDQFLLDKASGRIWNNVCTKSGKNGECSETAWTREYVEGVD